MSKKHEPANTQLSGRGKKALRTCAAMLLAGAVILALCPAASAAANPTSNAGATDPVAVVNNMSSLLFGIIRAIGLILLGFGIVQVGMSLKSHDPSQRANGFLTLAGGILITFTKEILDLITGSHP